MLDYYIILLVTFLGLSVGSFLSKIAWEEIAMYRKFLIAIQVLSLLAVIILSLNTATLAANTMFVLFVFYLLAVKYQVNSWIYSFILPIIYFIAYNAPNTAYAANLLFLHGFAFGSLQSEKLGRKKGTSLDGMLYILKKNILYLVVGAILGTLL